MTGLPFVFGDPHVCTGCMICVSVCSMHYYRVISPERSRVRVVRLEGGLDFPLFCRNCEDAPCIEACPEDALARTSKGVIVVNSRRCTGCGSCVSACPYYAIRVNPDTGKAFKCIQCGECTAWCPVGAIWMTTGADLEKRDPDGRLRGLYELHASEIYDKGEVQ